MKIDSYLFYPDYELDHYEEDVLLDDMNEPDDYDLIPQSDDNE